MAARPTWKGYLKVSLVTIPVKVFPATESAAALSFNQLHAECQTRIQQKRWCPHCEREVSNTELVKGYEFEKGRYVVVTEEDIQKVRVESTRVIDLAAVHRRDATSIRSTWTARTISRPTARWPPIGVCGDARRHGGEGRHRQGGALRPRVPRGDPAAEEGARDVHAASRRRDSRHRSDRGAELACRRRSSRKR